MRNTFSIIAAGAVSGAASLARAHEGHGLIGSHWHTSDVAGLAALGLLIALAAWLSKK